RQDHDLFVAHAYRLTQPVNPRLPKLRRQYPAALSQSLSRNHQHQHSGRLQPAVRMGQEDLLHALAPVLPEFGPIGAVLIEQTQALYRTLRFQRVALDDVLQPLPRLLGPVAVQLDAVTKNRSVAGQSSKGYAVAHAWVNSGATALRKSKKAAEALSLGNRQ